SKKKDRPASGKGTVSLRVVSKQSSSTGYPASSKSSNASRKIRPFGMAMVNSSIPFIFPLPPSDDAIRVDLRRPVRIIGGVENHRFPFCSEFLRPPDRRSAGGTGINQSHPFPPLIRSGARFHDAVGLQSKARRRSRPAEALRQPVVAPAAHQGKAGGEGIPFKINTGVVMDAPHQAQIQHDMAARPEILQHLPHLHQMPDGGLHPGGAN